MKLQLAFFVLLILLISCSQENSFPEKKSTRIPVEKLKLQPCFSQLMVDVSKANVDFSELNNFILQFETRQENFSLIAFEQEWDKFRLKNNTPDWNDAALKKWINITGLLLELTNNPKYAEELEQINLKSGNILQYEIAPYILTKQIDHIFVNLFLPVETSYNHTLGGELKLIQETDYPKSGSVKIHFEMTERRYMELFIRIPSWAEGSTVSVKQVKYFAAPGTYCKIAKKWKEGDLVEIELPVKKTHISKSEKQIKSNFIFPDA